MAYHDYDEWGDCSDHELLREQQLESGYGTCSDCCEAEAEHWVFECGYCDECYLSYHYEL